MERTVLKCSLALILNNFYKKSWSRNRPLKSLIRADNDDILHNSELTVLFTRKCLGLLQYVALHTQVSASEQWHCSSPKFPNPWDCESISVKMFLSLSFRGWSSMSNFGFRGWAASNVVRYPTFRQTLQFPQNARRLHIYPEDGNCNA
jgi:hypothetical protein